MANSRDTWYVQNVTTSMQISISDLPKLPTLGPGQKIDMLSLHTKEAIELSKALLVCLNKGWVIVTKITDGSNTTVNSDNAQDALSPATVDEITGGGTSYNQSLNTTDSVQFNSVNVQSGSGIFIDPNNNNALTLFTPFGSQKISLGVDASQYNFQNLSLHGSWLYMNDGSGSDAGNILMDSGYIYFSNLDGQYDNPAYIARGSGGSYGGGVSLYCNNDYEMNWQNGMLKLNGPEGGGITFADNTVQTTAFTGAALDGSSLYVNSGNSVMFNGSSDNNWRMGIISELSTSLVGSTTSIQIITGAGNSGPDGFAVGNCDGQSWFEVDGDTGQSQFNGNLTANGPICVNSNFPTAVITTDNDGGINFTDNGGFTLQWNAWDWSGLSTNGQGIDTGGGTLSMGGGLLYMASGPIYLDQDAYLQSDGNGNATFTTSSLALYGNINISTALTLSPQTTAPSNPTEGTMYVDTSHNLKIRLNGAWKTVTVS